MNNFGPLDPDVWGTVADWFVGLVTAVTAWFLWKTLRSQLEVQQAQNMLVGIEQYRHKIDVKPHFKAEIPISNTDIIFPLFTCYNSQAKKVAIKLRKHNSDVVIDSNSFDVIFPGQTACMLNDTNVFGPTAILIYSITFQDVTGNNYKQDISVFYVSSGKIKIHNSVPIEIL